MSAVGLDPGLMILVFRGVAADLSPQASPPPSHHHSGRAGGPVRGTATVATEVCDYERYTRHGVWEGARHQRPRLPFLTAREGEGRPAGRDRPPGGAPPLKSERHRTGRKGLATATCQCRAVDRTHETQQRRETRQAAAAPPALRRRPPPGPAADRDYAELVVGPLDGCPTTRAGRRTKSTPASRSAPHEVVRCRRPDELRLAPRQSRPLPSLATLTGQFTGERGPLLCEGEQIAGSLIQVPAAVSGERVD